MSHWTPIAAAADSNILRNEVESLGTALATQGGLEVHLAEANKIPTVMHEIGRHRETCFRSIGEGTGKALDLDQFDPHYLHLFLWDPKAGQIAGGYRMGCTDTIVEQHGPEGLVTASFFKFESAFIDYLNPALEMGRAFVTQDYQKSIYPLALLWKGIGAFIVENPRYTKLFGCVSISDDYTRISQDLIVRYMRKEHTNSLLAKWVRPTLAYEELPQAADISPQLNSIEQVSARIADSEPDGKGVPVLLRQYLKLNATLLEFNVDPEFNNSLDALVLLNLRDAPAKMLSRYLGKEGSKAVMS